MQYYVADLGTTNSKLAVVQTPYTIIETIEARNIIDQDETGKHESNPERVVQQLKDLLAQMALKYPEIDRLIFSTQMHALLATNRSGEVFMQTMTWADLRAKEVAKLMHEDGRGEKIFQISGTPIHAMNPFVKLAYLNDAKAELFHKDEIQFMDIKAYIIRSLTGEFVIDYPTASSMGLLDLSGKKWSSDLLQQVNVNENQLPSLQAPTASYPVKADILAELGLPSTFQLLLGSTDGALANLANLAYAVEGTAQTELVSPFVFSFGTSGAIRYLSEVLVINTQGALFTYMVDEGDHYIVGGPLNNAGNVLDWLYQNFAFKELGMTFSQMLEALHNEQVTDHGPYFLPYLNGERAPYWNAFLRAEFKELAGNTSRLAMAKAVFEGVFLEARQVIELVLSTTDVDVPSIQVNGKIFTNPAICQWIANILGVPLQYVSSEDASVVGAGIMIEGPGLKQLPDVKIVTPQVAEAALYDVKFQSFKYHADQADVQSYIKLYI